jgi:hypothetical protein
MRHHREVWSASIATAANVVLCGIGFLVAARLSAIMVVVFLVIGAVARLWSKRWWTVVIPAAAGFLWGLGALKWAIHLTDTRGEYAPSMSSYVLHPSLAEVIWALAAGLAAGLGWWLASRLLVHRRMRLPEHPAP